MSGKTIIWEDPPVKGNSGGDVIDFVNELKNRPGCWAKYPNEYKSQNSANAAASRMKGKFGCETTTRGNFIYARWIEVER